MQFVGIGKTRVQMFDYVIRILCDVRHVPDLRKEKFSLGSLDGNGLKYKFANGVMKVRTSATTMMKRQKLVGKHVQANGCHKCRWSYNCRVQVPIV